MQRQLVEVITVGIPFCAFKILTGVALLGPAAVVGWCLIGLGGADLIINLVNVVSLPLRRKRALGVCALQMLVTRRLRGDETHLAEIATSADVFLSFLLVAAMIGMGGLAALSTAGLTAWNYAVVANVLGAGAGRLYSSYRASNCVAPTTLACTIHQ